MDRKGEDAIQSGYTPGMVMHKWESYHNFGDPPQGIRGPNPTLVFPGKGFCNGKNRPPECLALKKQWSLCLREPDSCRKHRPFS